ncbi:MAG: hypothetical protein R3F19_26685 [Verrucomicrobiales bacterium]
MNESRISSYGKVMIALAVIFCAGQAVGYLWAARLSPQASSNNKVDWSERWAADTLNALRSQLDLTDKQAGAIELRLRETGESIQQERQRALFQIHLNILDFHSEIEGDLTEEQIVKLNESREKLKHRMQREFPEIMKNKG